MPVCPQCGSEYRLPARFCGQCGASLPEPAPEAAADPWLGRTIDKRYRVLSLIGSGGMGLVYRVEHIQLGKIAAMKVLHADTARDSEAVRRFRTEAQAVSRLSHPNIVQTFDFGQWDGSLYLVMEYVRGDDLSTVLKREGPLAFAQAAPLFVQICSALTDAHEAGVIHRDLKPENIVVVTRRTGAAHAKVLDFGLAKLRERPDGAEITSRGQVIGTPYYMSPEQVRSEALDVRTDIYSLGATFYRVLTGTPPFQAATPVGVLAMHLTAPLEPPRSRAPELNLPAAADAIIARAMAKARDERYVSAAEIQHDLELAIREVAHAEGVQGGTAPRRPTPRPTPLAPTLLTRPALVAPGRPVWDSDTDDHDLGDPSGARAPGDTGGTSEDSDAEDDAQERDPASGSGDRLRKQDFDAFERSLRRKKRIATLAGPALLLAIVSVGLWALGRGREKASSVEREPNDTPAQATLVPLDIPVQGRVGARQTGGQPDLDYYRIPAGPGPRVVSARLDGIAGVDLVLELYDTQGAALAKVDAHGVGGGEWMQPTSIGSGDAYLLVRPVWIQGSDVIADAPDPYRLSVHWGAPAPGWELEPNDWRDHANPVQVGTAVKGYLGSAEDKDWFLFLAPGAGTLAGHVEAPEGVDIAVTIGEMPWPPAPAAPGRSAARKPDRPTEIKIPVRAGEQVLVGLTRRLPAAATDPKAETVVGLDAPYELKLELRAARQ